MIAKKHNISVSALFLNKVDLIKDPTLITIALEETKNILKQIGYDSSIIPIIC